MRCLLILSANGGRVLWSWNFTGGDFHQQEGRKLGTLNKTGDDHKFIGAVDMITADAQGIDVR
jgi:hypothetical protein